MANEVINVDGEDKVVREDTAKSYRGVVWALFSVGAFIVILAILLFSGILNSATDNKQMQSPSQIEQKRQ